MVFESTVQAATGKQSVDLLSQESYKPQQRLSWQA